MKMAKNVSPTIIIIIIIISIITRLNCWLKKTKSTSVHPNIQPKYFSNPLFEEEEA